MSEQRPPTKQILHHEAPDGIEMVQSHEQSIKNQSNRPDNRKSIDAELQNINEEIQQEEINVFPLKRHAPKAIAHGDHTKMGAKFNEVKFPRTDNYFTTKSSLAFQEVQSRVWQNRVPGSWEGTTEIITFIILGFLVGFTGFAMDVFEMLIVYGKDYWTQYLIDSQKEGYILAWLFYSLYGTVFCLISCVMTTWWGTGAFGSGVAEIIGHLNGVNYPDCINPKTLVTKAIGVTLAVAGGLTVGKEGPLAHIGGNIGAGVPYLLNFDFLKNDHKKRHLIAAGASSGVSIAFGAPIGGALFLYELSRANPFWKFHTIWKIFLTCATATFTLGMLDALLHHKTIDWSESSLKFGVANKNLTTPTSVLPGAIIIGLASGLLGPFFININTRINGCRGKIYAKKWSKPIDCFIFAFLTASSFYWAPYIWSSCVPRVSEKAGVVLAEKTDTIFDRMEDVTTSRAWCTNKEEYNPLATIFWKTEGGVIRQFMATDMVCTPIQMLVFGVVWYWWTITTYGVNVPSGLFLPGMIIGCALGDLYCHFIQKTGFVMEDHTKDFRTTYIVLSMGAMLAGYTRMTYSLVVIVMETSQSVNIFIPICVSVAIANFVGEQFTRSLYERAVRGKQMPIITSQMPFSNRYLRAEQLMSSDVFNLSVVETVTRIQEAIKSPYHGFPVVNLKGRCVGLIPKNYLVILIQNKVFYGSKDQVHNGPKQELFSNELPIKRKKSSIARKREEDAEPFMIEAILDHDIYPKRDAAPLAWNNFCVPYLSLNREYTDSDVKDICEQNQEQLIDIRPYMIENPESCTRFDFFPKLVARFRHLHLRHMVVANAYTGEPEGIITRGDIFKFMPL